MTTPPSSSPLTTSASGDPALTAPIYAIASSGELVEIDAGSGAQKVIAHVTVPDTFAMLRVEQGAVSITDIDAFHQCWLGGVSVATAGGVKTPVGPPRSLVVTSPDGNTVAIVSAPERSDGSCGSERLDLVDRSGQPLASLDAAPTGRPAEFLPAKIGSVVWFGDSRSLMITVSVPDLVAQESEDSRPPQLVETRIVRLDQPGSLTDEAAVLATSKRGTPYERVDGLSTLMTGEVAAFVRCCEGVERAPTDEGPPVDLVAFNAKGDRRVIAKGPFVPYSAGPFDVDPTGSYMTWINGPLPGELYRARLDGSEQLLIGKGYTSVVW